MELSIDTVGERSSLAVSDQGALLAEITWRSGRRHTPSLTPMIDQVCALASEQGSSGDVREGLEAVFVDVGPGAYGGIRAGMAAAAGLAVALELPCVGVGRLEIEAWAHAGAGMSAAIHRAARETWAWQLFWGPLDRWRPYAAPRTGNVQKLAQDLTDAARVINRPGLVCGEAHLLDAVSQEALRRAKWSLATPSLSIRRASLLAELGWRELSAGRAVPPAALEPLYLRDPAIGPQPPRRAD